MWPGHTKRSTKYESRTWPLCMVWQKMRDPKKLMHVFQKCSTNCEKTKNRKYSTNMPNTNYFRTYNSSSHLYIFLPYFRFRQTNEKRYKLSARNWISRRIMHGRLQFIVFPSKKRRSFIFAVASFPSFSSGFLLVLLLLSSELCECVRFFFLCAFWCLLSMVCGLS